MSKQHQDHTIDIAPDWTFAVTGPLFASERPETFPSLKAATEEIDKRLATKVKEHKAQEQTALHLLSDKGVPVTVRGIHSGTQALLGPPDDGDVYPDVPWLKDAVLEQAKLSEESAKLDAVLRHYRIRNRRGYGRIKAENYEAAIEALTAEVAKKTEAAKARQGKVEIAQ